jgi:hypothetical protein
MKKTLAIIFILLFFKSVSYGDNTLAYKNEAKKYMTEIIYSAMETYEFDYCKDHTEAEYLESPQNSSMIVFSNIYLKKSDWEYEMVYLYIRDEGWSTLARELLSQWKSVLKKDTFSVAEMQSLLSKKIVYPYGESEEVSSVFYDKVVLIKSDYASRLSTIGTEPVEEISQEDESDSSAFPFGLFFSILLNFILFIICFFLYKLCKKNELNIENIKMEFKRLNNINTSRNDRPETTFPPKEKILTPKKEANQVKEPSVVLDNVCEYNSIKIYFEEFENGAFAINDSRRTRGDWSIFCITTISDTEGCLDLLYNNMSEDIIANRQTCLHESICDVVYQEGGSLDEIVKVTPGEVILKGGNWYVSKKLNVVIN